MDDKWLQQQKDGVTLYTANKDNVFFEIYTGANRLEVIIRNLTYNQIEYYNLKVSTYPQASPPKRTIKELLNMMPYVNNMPVELGNMLVQAERQTPQKITEQILPPQPIPAVQPVPEQTAKTTPSGTEYYP